MKKQLSALFLALMMVLLCALPASADVQLKTVNYSNGDVYIGQVKDGLPHGVGTYTMTDGTYYHGDFVDGHFDGKGIYVWPSGNSYTGDFVRDMFQGKGVYTWASGRQGYAHLARRRNLHRRFPERQDDRLRRLYLRRRLLRRRIPR